jgi:hypothetical protein
MKKGRRGCARAPAVHKPPPPPKKEEKVQSTQYKEAVERSARHHEHDKGAGIANSNRKRPYGVRSIGLRAAFR